MLRAKKEVEEEGGEKSQCHCHAHGIFPLCPFRTTHPCPEKRLKTPFVSIRGEKNQQEQDVRNVLKRFRDKTDIYGRETPGGEGVFDIRVFADSDDCRTESVVLGAVCPHEQPGKRIFLLSTRSGAFHAAVVDRSRGGERAWLEGRPLLARLSPVCGSIGGR